MRDGKRSIKNEADRMTRESLARRGDAAMAMYKEWERKIVALRRERDRLKQRVTELEERLAG